MTTDQFEELKAIQDAYLEMATKRQEAVKEPLEEAVGGFGSHYSKSEKEKEMADDHKDEKETSYRSKSPKRSGFSALDRLKAKQGIKEEEVFESERAEKYKNIVSSLDRIRAKATANAELQKLQKQNKDRKKLPEEVESLEEEKISVNHAYDAVGSVLGQSAAVKFATNLKAGTAKYTTWKDINKTLVKQGEQTHHIAKIAAKLKPAQYNEEIEELDEISDKLATNYTAKSQKAYNDPKTTPEKKANRRKGLITAYLKSKAEANVPTTYESVEELDEVSMATLDSYRKKAFDEPGFKRQAGRALAYDKSGSHGDSKVKSSEEIANAKSQIKTLIKPEHHSKYPIHKITSHTSARKIYKDASAAGHLKEEVELEEAKKEPMEVYHTGYSAALQHAEKHLNKQGYDIHPDDWQQHISHGPSKPSEGKTVQLHVPLHKDGVKSKKVAHIQVYNRGNTIPKNYELNMYVN